MECSVEMPKSKQNFFDVIIFFDSKVEWCLNGDSFRRYDRGRYLLHEKKGAHEDVHLVAMSRDR